MYVIRWTFFIFQKKICMETRLHNTFKTTMQEIHGLKDEISELKKALNLSKNDLKEKVVNVNGKTRQ